MKKFYVLLVLIFGIFAQNCWAPPTKINIPKDQPGYGSLAGGRSVIYNKEVSLKDFKELGNDVLIYLPTGERSDDPKAFGFEKHKRSCTCFNPNGTPRSGGFKDKCINLWKGTWDCKKACGLWGSLSDGPKC